MVGLRLVALIMIDVLIIYLKKLSSYKVYCVYDRSDFLRCKLKMPSILLSCKCFDGILSKIKSHLLFSYIPEIKDGFCFISSFILIKNFSVCSLKTTRMLSTHPVSPLEWIVPPDTHLISLRHHEEDGGCCGLFMMVFSVNLPI